MAILQKLLHHLIPDLASFLREQSICCSLLKMREAVLHILQRPRAVLIVLIFADVYKVIVAIPSRNLLKYCENIRLEVFGNQEELGVFDDNIDIADVNDQTQDVARQA
jgi:hypothetical protein